MSEQIYTRLLEKLSRGENREGLRITK